MNVSSTWLAVVCILCWLPGCMESPAGLHPLHAGKDRLRVLHCSLKQSVDTLAASAAVWSACSFSGLWNG